MSPRGKKTSTKEASIKNTASIGFEEQIWKAADLLRGNLDASEYKSVVLGLIFLKYLSDRFEEKHAELLEEEPEFAEERDAYQEENILFIPSTARWQVIANASKKPEIGDIIDKAMGDIEEENPSLKGVLPKNFGRPELDKIRLGNVIDLFTNIKTIDHSNEIDLLGRTYEYCLSRFAEQEGKHGGEFYTPSCIVRTLVAILKPLKGRVFDPCCGSGGMFVQSAKFIANHAGNIKNVSVYGQEFNSNTWRMAKMNLAIRGIEADLASRHADSFLDDQHKNLRADFIMANPPFNMSEWGGDMLQGDVRWKYGQPPEGNANYAWIQHMIHHLAPTGRMGIVLANGALSSQSSGEGEIRKKIIEADLVECIVALPGQLFYTTQIPVSLWFITKKKALPNKILFLDARNLGSLVTRKLRELSDADIQRLADAYDAYVAGTLENEAGFSAVVSTEDIAEQDFILTPGRYVGIEEQEEDEEPFDDKMKRLTAELKELFEQSNALQEEIKKNLKAVGYEI